MRPPVLRRRQPAASLTSDECLLVYRLPPADVDEHSPAPHAANGLCIDELVCLVCVGKGCHHIVTVSHELVELVWCVHLQLNSNVRRGSRSLLDTAAV